MLFLLCSSRPFFPFPQARERKKAKIVSTIKTTNKMTNITLTLTSLSSQKTDSIEICSSTTTLSDLCQYAVALLDLPSSDNIILSKDGTRIYSSSENVDSNISSRAQSTLSSAGIKNGDMIVVLTGASSTSSSLPIPVPSTTTNNNERSSNGGLDFSSLLSSASSTNTNVNSASSSSNNNGGGGLQFNLPMLSGSLFGQQMIQSTPVQWDGMTLDDAMARNPNPDCFIKVLLDEKRHGNLLKELNYHSPSLAKKLKAAGLQASAFFLLDQS